MGCLFSSQQQPESQPSSGANQAAPRQQTSNTVEKARARAKASEAVQDATQTPIGSAAIEKVGTAIEDAAAGGGEEGQEESAQGEESGNGDGSAPLLDLAKQAVASVTSLMGRSKERGVAPNIQELQLEQRTPAEKALAKYSELGRVVVELSGRAAAAFPFGAPAAAMLGAVYGRAAQAAKNSNNCRLLLVLLKRCDQQMARAARGIAERAASGQQPVDAEVTEGMAQLTDLLLQGAELMATYTNRGFIMRTISSTSDMVHFQRLHTGIQMAMERMSFAVTIEVLEGKYSDESAPLRAAVCKAAGRPESEAEMALQDLRRDQPDLLRQMLRDPKIGNFSDQVVASEMDAISERLAAVEADVSVCKVEIKGVKSEVQYLLELSDKNGSRPPPGLAGFLASWWAQSIHELKQSTTTKKFMDKLISWAQANGFVPRLLKYEETLEEELEEGGIPASSLHSLASITLVFEGKPLLFLERVFLPLLDQDKNGIITLSELRRLQLIAYGFAEATDFESVNASGTNEPSSWQELLDAIYRGFNRAKLIKPGVSAANDGLHTVTEALNVQGIMTFDIASLLDHYIEGTRRWMFDRVNAWLDRVLGELDTASPDSAVVPDSRMFLLLAGPGMGKSVFSAALQTKLMVRTHQQRKLIQVRHFFKVGQSSAQGKAMVLNLTRQLCEQLPGMVDMLLPVVKEHGNGGSLSLTDAFQTFLLNPLLQLDKRSDVQGMHVVVILLDALDEACDGPCDFEAITALVSKEFIKLPAWVKIVATGRPEAEASLAAWAPAWIKPDEAQNLADMRVLLEACLRRGDGLVAENEMEAAVNLLLAKSEGQFVYAKYAFDTLVTKRFWSLSELQHALPSGLAGMYCHVLKVMQDALRNERPDLLTILRERVLPILVAAREPLSPGQLSFLAKASAEDVDLLLRLLSSLFSRRPVGDGGTVHIFAYHKTVVDWLMDPKAGPEFAVDAQTGHSCLGQACFDAVMTHAKAPLPAAVEEEKVVLVYALRHSVYHLSLSEQNLSTLEVLVLDVVGFWPAAFQAGCGAEVLIDLIALAPKKSEVVRDVIRWLRLTGSYLMRHPRAALQLACDAPRNSLVAKHAHSLPERPQAVLLTKDDDWSACLSVLTGHTLGETKIALSLDARVCVSGSDDKTVRVWDLHSGTCTATFEGHAGVVCVALSPDARVCVSGHLQNTLSVWDLHSGACTANLKGHTYIVASVALSHDARVCVSGSWDKTIRVWDLHSGACTSTLEGHTAFVTSVTLSPDACVCVSGSGDCTLRVWDLHSGTCTCTLQGHTKPVSSVAMSPDARVCVSGSRDCTLRVWDLHSRACTSTLEGHTDQVWSVALSPDACACVSGSDDCNIRVWDLNSGACTASLNGHTKRVASVALSPDKGVCVSGSQDKTLRVWDLHSRACKATPREGHTNEVKSVALSSDARVCVSGSSDCTLRVWDLHSGACGATLKGHTKGVTRVVLSPDARMCVSNSMTEKTMRVWDLHSGACKATLRGHTGYVTGVALSPDARVCISGSSWDITIRKWDAVSGEQLACFPRDSQEGGQLQALADSWGTPADGLQLNGETAWMGDDGRIIQWGVAEAGSGAADSPTAYLMPPAHTDSNLGVFYSASGRTVSCFVKPSYAFLCYKILV